MSDEEFLLEARKLIEKVTKSESNNFFELAKIAGLNLAEDIAGADLERVNFSEGSLTGADLSDTDLNNANLSGTNLAGANLSNANLTNANLSNANLTNANLSNANLTNANLSNANLTNANLSNASLGGAELTGANLNGTNLTIFLPTSEVKDIAQIALQKRREVLDVKFEFPDVIPHEAPLGPLGTIFLALQGLLDAIGQVIDGNPTVVGQIPKKITQATRLTTLNTFPGSFGVELAAPPHKVRQLSLLEDPTNNLLAPNSIDELLKLINSTSDHENLREYLHKLKRRTASRYLQFLVSLVAVKTGCYIDWGSVDPNRGGSAELTFETAKAAIKIVTQIQTEPLNEYDIIGVLVGGNYRTKDFEIRDIENEEKYHGSVDNTAISQVENATLGEIYVATIQDVLEVTPVTGKEKIIRKLIKLEFLGDERQFTG